MDSVLEEKRSLHEERDRIELAIVNEMLAKKTGHRDRLDSEHRQKILLSRYMNCSKKLAIFYEASEADNQPEQNQNSGSTMTKAFNDFYLALREIREFYDRHSNEQVVTLANEFDELEAVRQVAMGVKSKNSVPESATSKKVINLPVQENDQDDSSDEYPNHPIDREAEIRRLTQGLPSTDLVELAEDDHSNLPIPVAPRVEKLVEFTDEEAYGRYLDLSKCHEAFLQVLKREEVKPNYLEFLDKFDRFSEMNRECKINSAYKNYVEMLLEYFRDYGKRAKPLVDFPLMETKAHDKFLQDWTNKTCPGWFDESDRLKTDNGEQIDLIAYKSKEELMELGLDCLKQELQARGIKCGGTLEERANRLWSIRGKSKDDIDDSLRAAPVVSNKKLKRRSNIEPFTLASIESKLSMYSEYFESFRQATIENVQRKQARTAEERNESDEDISDLDDDDNDQNDVIYNPKNLPLGWDGKPIPYWLYKLHGLNLTFVCEICGNATYKGPKTFQRHFAEWRHAHGMRCLGIPNTAHFANITKIQDAISLWDKLKLERQKDKFQAQNEEEYEDSQGNVVNKKTYEDLKRQGLL